MVFKAIKNWFNAASSVFTEKATLDEANAAPYKLEVVKEVEQPETAVVEPIKEIAPAAAITAKPKAKRKATTKAVVTENPTTTKPKAPRKAKTSK